MTDFSPSSLIDILLGDFIYVFLFADVAFSTYMFIRYRRFQLYKLDSYDSTPREWSWKVIKFTMYLLLFSNIDAQVLTEIPYSGNKTLYHSMTFLSIFVCLLLLTMTLLAKSTPLRNKHILFYLMVLPFLAIYVAPVRISVLYIAPIIIVALFVIYVIKLRAYVKSRIEEEKRSAIGNPN